YAHMRNDQDTTNDFYQALNQKAESLLTLFSSTMSFIVPEILSMDETTIDQFLKENEDLQLYKKVLDDISSQRAHILSEKEEALLSEASEPLDAAFNTFGMLSNADIRFPEIIDDEGEKTELTQGRYINFMESKNREVRKGAFHAMHDTIGSYINTFASRSEERRVGKECDDIWIIEE